MAPGRPRSGSAAVTFARGLSRVLAGVNCLLLVLVGTDATGLFSDYTGGEGAVALVVVLLVGGLAAGLVGGKIAAEVPALWSALESDSRRLRRTGRLVPVALRGWSSPRAAPRLDLEGPRFHDRVGSICELQAQLHGCSALELDDPGSEPKPAAPTMGDRVAPRRSRGHDRWSRRFRKHQRSATSAPRHTRSRTPAWRKRRGEAVAATPLPERRRSGSRSRPRGRRESAVAGRGPSVLPLNALCRGGRRARRAGTVRSHRSKLKMSATRLPGPLGQVSQVSWFQMTAASPRGPAAVKTSEGSLWPELRRLLLPK